MPAFNTRQYPLIEASLNALSQRAIANHYSPTITKAELYPALVRPEHMQVLTEADNLAGPLQEHGSIAIPVVARGKRVEITLHFKESLSRVLPPYVNKNGFHDEADPNVVAQVQAWAERRIDIGEKWIRVKRLLGELNRKLSNHRQMAFYCNGVVALMNGQEDLRKHAAKLSDFKVPAIVPGLSAEMRAAGVEATQTIARSLLLSGDSEPPRETRLTISTVSYGTIKMPWHGDNVNVFYID